YAREGNGPTLIEAVTWRKGAHTTADDPSKYRSEESGKNIIDPIVRLQRFMENKGFWDIEMIQTIQSDIEKEVDDAIKGMESYPKANVNDMFDHVYKEMPEQLRKQKEDYLASLGGK